MTTFAYKTVGISDIIAKKEADPRDPRKDIVKKIEIEDEEINPSHRFWISIGARYGFSPSIFKWFDHHEVFERISEKSVNDRIRIAIETSDTGVKTALGATNPGKPLIAHDQLLDLLEEYGNTESHEYHDGIVTSTHALRHNVEFDVAGDVHKQRFTMSTPIDGYGQPNIYLSLLREVCTNGMIAMSKAFRTSLSIGRDHDNTDFSVRRALDAFNNEEGFHALRQRIESSGKSWASLYESYTLAQVLQKAILNSDIENSDTVATNFQQQTGDLATIYGLAQMTEMSKKRMKTLPCKSTVYDLINFATECATHHCNNQGSSLRFQAWCGGIISQEYDLENTKETYSEFTDWFSKPEDEEEVEATVSVN
jgi:hypothetical protein